MSPATTVPLNIPGLDVPLSLQVHGQRDRVISERLRREGVWEPYETQLVLNLLEPGGVFVDVGANLGYFSILAAACVGEQGRVYAFEPDPDNFALLQANSETNGFGQRICAVNAALAERDGSGRLYLSEDNLGDHQLFDVDGERATREIRMLQGGAFLTAESVSQISLLKVDTQGSEFAVMAGMLPFLRAQPQPTQILIELTPLSLRQAGASGRALIGSLETLGEPFWIVDHIEHRLVATPAADLARWCDNVDATPGDQGFMNILVGQGLDSE